MYSNVYFSHQNVSFLHESSQSGQNFVDIFLYPMHTLSEVSANSCCKRHYELSNICYVLCVVVSRRFAAKALGTGFILILSQVSVVQWSMMVEQWT